MRRIVRRCLEDVVVHLLLVFGLESLQTFDISTSEDVVQFFSPTSGDVGVSKVWRLSSPRTRKRDEQQYLQDRAAQSAAFVFARYGLYVDRVNL